MNQYLVSREYERRRRCMTNATYTFFDIFRTTSAISDTELLLVIDLNLRLNRLKAAEAFSKS